MPRISCRTQRKVVITEDWYSLTGNYLAEGKNRKVIPLMNILMFLSFPEKKPKNVLYKLLAFWPLEEVSENWTTSIYLDIFLGNILAVKILRCQYHICAKKV